MVFSVEVMHYRILRVDQFVNVGHEVANGFCIGFVDLLKKLDVGDSLFVVGNESSSLTAARVLRFSK
jgi:hypothetical protein